MFKAIGRLKGWQKFWLAVTVGMVILGVAWLPGVLERTPLAELAAARERMVADFEKPECLPVRSTPYSQLTPVSAGAPCHEIYVWRRDVKEKLPLVLSNVVYPMEAHRREIWLQGAMKGVGVAAFVSALLYAGLALAQRRMH